MKKTLTWLVIALFGLGFAIGCSDDDDDSATDYFEDVAALGYEYIAGGTKNITADAVYADIDNANLYIIDWRSADHYALGHIQGAMNASIANIVSVTDDIPAGAKIINVCYTGQTASQATMYHRMLGLDAYNLKFGMCGWTNDETIHLNKWHNQVTDVEEWPMETTVNNMTTTYEFDEMSNSSWSSDVDALKAQAQAYFSGGTHNISDANLWDATGDYYIVNWFPSSNYEAGHVDGAYRLYGDNGGWNLDNLAYLPTDMPIVVYCWTGQTSSQITAFLNILGYDAYSLLYGAIGMTTDENIIMKGDGSGPMTFHGPDGEGFPVVTE